MWVHVCALAQAAWPPGEALRTRQSVQEPLRKELGVVIPVSCLQILLCFALVLAALLVPPRAPV